MTSKSILILVAKYGGPGESPHITNELASAIRAQGHEVQVVSLEWSREPGLPPLAYRQADNIEVLFLSPRPVSGFGLLFERLTKWLGSSVFAAREADRQLGGRHFDLVFAFAPAVSLGSLIRWSLRRFKPRSFLYVADFFPFAGRSTGLIPAGPIFTFARLAEAALFRKFDTIGCMSPANLRFLQRHYRLKPGQRAIVLPLWGPTSQVGEVDVAAVRARYGLPPNTPVALFGGGLIEGRGIEEILAAAAEAKASGLNLHFLMIGAGRLAGLVERFVAEGRGNLTWLEKIPRDEYLAVAAACDVGLVVTVAHFGGPSFPSKTIDYLRAGLPIVASVEKTTDYGAFVVERGIGQAVEAGSPTRLLQAIVRIIAEPEALARYRLAGRRTLEEVFDVDRTAKRVLEQIFHSEGKAAS